MIKDSDVGEYWRFFDDGPVRWLIIKLVEERKEAMRDTVARGVSCWKSQEDIEIEVLTQFGINPKEWKPQKSEF